MMDGLRGTCVCQESPRISDVLLVVPYLLVRALESGGTRHLVLCGIVVGLTFRTKMLHGWMVVPALAAAFAVRAGPAVDGVSAGSGTLYAVTG
jgi:hypothetical protein